MQQPDQSDIPVPPKEKKFKGYFKIARHYGWALNYTFFKFNFDTVIIVEGKRWWLQSGCTEQEYSPLHPDEPLHYPVQRV